MVSLPLTLFLFYGKSVLLPDITKKMKKFTIVLLLMVFAVAGSTQTVEGSWLLTKAEIEGQVQEPWQITEFREDGKMVIFGMELGTWKYNKKKQTIDMTSGFDKDFAGENKVLTLNENEMVLDKDGAKLFYSRYLPEQTAMMNKFSDLAGTWQIQISNDVLGTLKFELPDSFVFIESQEGMTTTNRGTWIYNPADESLLIIGLRSFITGKSIIIEQSEDELLLEKNGEPILATKAKTESSDTGRLEFTEADFFDENGDYKYYEDEENLPWLNPYEMIMGLLDVHQLVYSYSTLIDETDAFKSKMLTADVVAVDEEQTLSIDFIFYGYDRYNLPEDTELPPNNNYTEPLFPLKDVSFRVAGQEQITTPAGIFDCTVVEAAGDFDEVLKLWMIDNKPGIYAKIIADQPGSFGHYHVYELQEIK